MSNELIWSLSWLVAIGLYAIVWRVLELSVSKPRDRGP